MIVVADASPLNYLIHIESEELLKKLYGRVIVPTAVIEELAHSADLLLIDEKEGRAEAKRRGLLTIGTLGVLLAAGNKGFIDPRDAFQKLLVDTTFHASADLKERFLSYCKKSAK